MKTVVLCLVLTSMLCCAAVAAQTVADAYYQADVRFPQFEWIWPGTSDVKGANPSANLGGTLRVYVKNTTDKTLEIEDVLMQGVSLKKAVAFSDQRKFKRYVYAASIYFSKLPKDQIAKVRMAGEPIWWRFQPMTLKPGELGELIVRLRRQPAGIAVKLSIIAKGGDKTEVSVPVGPKVPKFKDICFTPARDIVYLYPEHPQIGSKPCSILMNGVDVTQDSTIYADARMGISPVICKLKSPVAQGSLHCIQAIYPDGSKATSSVRAFDSEFKYGMWGALPGEEHERDLARGHINDLALHNINLQMVMIGSGAVSEFMKTQEGQELMRSHGIQRMVSEPGEGRLARPWGYFLADEPDTGDYRVAGIPHESKVGALCQGLVERQDGLHEVDPVAQGLVNMDYTFRPHHWYIYGQVPDILASDPYYQARLTQEAEYGKAPEKISKYKKATYIEGVTAICQSSQAPKPVHLVLLAAAGRDQQGGGDKYVTPQEKRIETYYAIGAGSKAISYWWFHGLVPGLKPGKEDPNAVAQWTSIGMVGAELRTAGPVITTSTPVSLPITAPKELWVRSLMRGNDTLILVCVNDDYSCDMKGINIKPLQNVEACVTVPSWLEPKSIFEISADGTSDMSADKSNNKVSLHLGTVDVTRLIVITSDQSLRTKLQQLYDSKFAANIAKIKTEQYKGVPYRPESGEKQ